MLPKKKKAYEQTTSKMSRLSNNANVESGNKKIVTSNGKSDLQSKDKDMNIEGKMDKSQVIEDNSVRSAMSKMVQNSEKNKKTVIDDQSAMMRSTRMSHNDERSIEPSYIKPVNQETYVPNYRTDVSSGMSKRLINAENNEYFVKGSIARMNLPNTLKAKFFDAMVDTGFMDNLGTGDVGPDYVTKETAQKLQFTPKVNVTTNGLEVQKNVEYKGIMNGTTDVDMLPRTELSNILQTSVLERKMVERNKLNTLVEALTEGNQYEGGASLQLPNYKTDGIDDVFSWVNLENGDTPPIMFNIMPSDGELYNGSYTTIMSSGAILGDNHNFNATADTFKQETPYVEYDWKPDGWLKMIHDPRMTEPQKIVTSLTIAGNRESFAGDIERFMSGLKTFITIYNNRRLILQSPIAVRVTAKLTKLGADKGVNLAGILRPATDVDADLEDEIILNNIRYEFFDSKMNGFPLFSIFTEVNEDWAKYACERFAAEGSRTLIGKSNLLSYKGQNYRGTAYALIDNFTAAFLQLNFNELSGNILSYNDFMLVVDALKFPQTEVSVIDTLRTPIFTKYGPTAEDKETLLFSLLLDNELKGDFINQSLGLMQSMNLFKVIENKTLFSETALSTVAAGKESSYLIAVASYYRSGSLNDFYNLILMEHYSSLFSINFNMREPLPTYLGLFNLLDILLLFNIAPKLCWSNSATLGKMVNTILACCFPNQYATYRARHGIISEYVNEQWAPTVLSTITQYDVVGGSGNPKQYSVLVANGRTGDDVTNRVYRIADMITFIGGGIDITRKQAAGFPYTSNLDEYRSSWPNVNIGAAFFEDNVLIRKMRLIIAYISSSIELSRRISLLDKIQMDRATFKQLMMNLNNLVLPFCNALCRFGNFISEVLANSYLIWHEWFDSGDFRFAQPNLGFRITRANDTDILLFNRFEANVSCSLATYCLINLVGITSTVNSTINKLSEINQTFTTEIIIDNIPTNDLVDNYFRYVYKSKKDSEDFAIVESWFGGVDYENYIRAFNTSVNNRTASNIGRYIADLVESHLFNALLSSTSLEFNVDSTDIRGEWDLVLTDDMGTNVYNDFDGNLAFGVELSYTSGNMTVYRGISQFLGLSNNSPIFKRATGFFISTNTVEVFNAYATAPDIEYRQILTVADNLNITSLVYYDDSLHVGSQVLRSQINLGDDVYYDVSEATISGRRYLIRIDTIARLRARDIDTIYELILARTLDLEITGMILEYKVIPTSEMSDFYSFEASKAHSWIRNTLLTNCVSSSILRYDFIDYLYPIRMQAIVSLRANRYVYLPKNVPNNIIAKSIITNPSVVNLIGRTIDTRVWNTLDDPLYYEDDVNIIDRRGVRLSNKYNFYYDYIVTDLPKVEIIGAVGFQ